MSKYVFRLHENASVGDGWFDSKKIDEKTIDSGTKSSEIATSIPSPFAQIELVRTAFKKVVELGIDGQTAHHRLVSEALDVGQLFFLSQVPRYKDQLKIVSWNIKKRIEHNSGDNRSNIVIERHKNLFKSIEKYFKQDRPNNNKKGKNDSVLYNFEELEEFYFLLSTKSNLVIGATSPITLFFAAPDVRYVCREDEINFHHHKSFFNQSTPLYERDHSFIEYMYWLSKQPNFNICFPDIDTYLEENLRKIKDSKLKEKASNIKGNSLPYDPCLIMGERDNFCKFLGIQLGVLNDSSDDIKKRIQSESDFVIKPGYDSEQKHLPLILPVFKEFSLPWQYVPGVEWSKETNSFVNHEDKDWLPNHDIKYTWYSRDDFLEDVIIKIPYPIDNDNFMPQKVNSRNYLLPLKPLFFEYFKPESIHECIKIEEYLGIVSVSLRIPVKRPYDGKVYVEFKDKEYSKHSKTVFELSTHLAISPFVCIKHLTGIKMNFYVGVLTDLNKKESFDEIRCDFYHWNEKSELNLYVEDIENSNDENKDNKVLSSERNDGEKEIVDNIPIEIQSKYYQTPPFDFIQVHIGDKRGVIIPQFKTKKSKGKLHFAIDLGTTNTHIAYKYYGDDVIDQQSFPYDGADNSNPDRLWESLLDRNSELKREIRSNSGEHKAKVKLHKAKIRECMIKEVIFEQELVPYGRLNFPVRSILVYNRKKTNNFTPILDANNYMLYGSKKIPKYLDESSNLKWDTFRDETQKSKLKCFIEHFLLLIYQKTILMGSDPNNTKITCLYPVCLNDEQVESMKEIWEDKYKQVFNCVGNDNLNHTPESLGPFYEHKGTLTGQKLTIDIGGGSTDIAAFKDELDFISSFKFGGNAIFGDGYNFEYAKDFNDNGFVRLFKDSFERSIKNDQKKVFDTILNNRNSVEFSNFLFSLSHKDHGIDYLNELKYNKKMIPVILTFFGAVIYYSAVLMKESIGQSPNHIIFSGGTSKLISIFKMNKFSLYLNSIFSNVFGYKNDRIEIKIEKEPKKVTCKGILKPKEIEKSSIPIVYWLGGSIENRESWVSKVVDYTVDFKENYVSKGTRKKKTYQEITDDAKNEISKSINKFFKLHDHAIEESDILDYLNDTLNYRINDIRSRHLNEYLLRGVKSFHNSNEEIQETLFFYPLIGVLNSLAFEFSES